MTFESDIPSTQPLITVGIMTGKVIQFKLDGAFSIIGDEIPPGNYKAEIKENQIEIYGELFPKKKFTEIIFEKVHQKHSIFTLHDVIIGIDFHWERKEDQQFSGSLKLIIENDKIRAINILPLEDYLTSVISSEMSSTSNIEFLKAHAVISRGWLLAQIEKNKQIDKHQKPYKSIWESRDEIIKWYDREDHVNFDVCADDHCQRYQGLTKVLSPNAEKAIEETSGIILTSEGKICDARFSKSCGGVTENFENVWEPVPHSYLEKVIDNSASSTISNINLKREENAEKWIKSSPEAFCNTTNKKILSQVLNDFDQETNDFYRWEVTYTQNELSKLILKKSGIDFGQIIDLIPTERGESGRLIKLKIVGTKKTLTIGKELEIRKTLSESHLYSSAFVVEKLNERNNIPGKFRIIGAGWGHGVGLCQIGAAIMSETGYTWKEILFHYFKNTELSKLY